MAVTTNTLKRTGRTRQTQPKRITTNITSIVPEQVLSNRQSQRKTSQIPGKRNINIHRIRTNFAAEDADRDPSDEKKIPAEDVKKEDADRNPSDEKKIPAEDAEIKHELISAAGATKDDPETLYPSSGGKNAI